MKLPALILALTLCAAAQEHKVLVHEAGLIPYPLAARGGWIQGSVKLRMQLLSDGRANVISFQGHPYFEATVRKSISEWRFVCADCFEKSTPEFDFVVKFDLSLDLCDFKGWINRLKTPQQVDVLASVCVDVLQSRASAVNHLN